MEYEGSIGLATGKKNFFFAYFHFLGLFSHNMIWAIKNFPSVTRRYRCRCKTKFVSRLQPSP
jgi:hypothetical protein